MSAENPCPMWLYGIACLLGVSEVAESQECGSSGCGQGGPPHAYLLVTPMGKSRFLAENAVISRFFGRNLSKTDPKIAPYQAV